jgi:hypothetical protein
MLLSVEPELYLILLRKIAPNKHPQNIGKIL